MSPSRPKPSEIAAEAKRTWLPYIWRTYLKDATTSYLYPESSAIRIKSDKKSHQRTRVAVMEGDPVTYALGWYQNAIRDPAHRNCKRIPVVNAANEKRAGGDWESGLMAPEECFARRSNLVHALTMPWNAQMGRQENFYPIPQRGGIYTPEVCTYNFPHHQQVLTLFELYFDMDQTKTTLRFQPTILYHSLLFRSLLYGDQSSMKQGRNIPSHRSGS
jgi:hypothetical protein